MSARNPVEADFELTDGSWQPHRAVLVWAPDDPEAFRRARTGDACGTNAGYQRHRNSGQPVCLPCRVAHNAATKARRVRQGDR